MNNNEIELKLLIDPADIPALRRHPLLRALCPGGPQSRKLLSIYFDTDDSFLKSQGMALRVRRDGRRWIQTVKGGGSVMAGLHQRDEWEAPVRHDRPDFTKLTEPSLIALFSDPILRQRLRPVFVTEFTRTIWLLETEADDRIEMALDRGSISMGTQATTISEVELELKAGQPAALYQVALALLEEVPLSAENASKAERGYALHLPVAIPQAVKAVPPAIEAETTVDAAFRAIAWCCLAHLQDNQSRLQQAYDPEYIHQMRVATRRLRSAFKLFSAAAPGIRDEALIEELRWLVGELGPARDWDVFLDELLQQAMLELPGNAALDALKVRAERLCLKARQRACSAAVSQRFQKLLLGLGLFIWRAPWRANAEDLARLDQPVKNFAARQLTRHHRGLRRRGRRIAALSVEQRHALRIAAKKLRYAAEFFSSLFPPKKSKSYLQALAELQDELGVLNDQAVTGRLLAQIEGGSKDLLRVRGVGLIIGWNACRARAKLADITQVWKRFHRRNGFWGEE